MKIRKILFALTLLASYGACAQTAINPSTQVHWPSVSGSGAPAATCTSANYGQPYTDTATGDTYNCASTGWVKHGAGGGGTVNASPQHACGFFPTSGTAAVVQGDTGCTLDGSGHMAAPSVNNVYSACTFTGSTADAQITACLAATPSGGTCDARCFGATTQSFAATVTVPRFVTLQGSPATKFQAATSGLNMFVFDPDSHIKGIQFDCSNWTSPFYSGSVFSNDPTQPYGNPLASTNPDSLSTSVDDILFNQSCLANNLGTALNLSSNSGALPVYFTSFTNWRVIGMLNGVWINAGSATGEVNDNHFVDWIFENTNYAAHLTVGGGTPRVAIQANVFSPFSVEKATKGVNVILNDGDTSGNFPVSNNTWQGTWYDYLDTNTVVSTPNFTANFFYGWENPTGQNVRNGPYALNAVTTGIDNTADGWGSLQHLTTGSLNAAAGYRSCYANITSPGNACFGPQALGAITGGSGYSIALGDQAGYFISDGVTPNQTSASSLYLGAFTKAFADGDTNETVLCYNCAGHGQNTTTIGNSTVTDTYITGTLHATIPGATSPENHLLQSGNPSISPWAVSHSGSAVNPVITALPGYLDPNGNTGTVYEVLISLNGSTNPGDNSVLSQTVTGATNPHTGTIGVWYKLNSGSTATFRIANAGAGGVSPISSPVLTATSSWQFESFPVVVNGTGDVWEIYGVQGTTTDPADLQIAFAQLSYHGGSYIATTSSAIDYTPYLYAPNGVVVGSNIETTTDGNGSQFVTTTPGGQISPSQIPGATAPTFVQGGVLCAHGSDTTILSTAITAGTATTLTVGALPSFFKMPGALVGVIGTTATGGTLDTSGTSYYPVVSFSGNTLTFASLGGTWTSGGTTFLGCANTTDAIASGSATYATQNPFALGTLVAGKWYSLTQQWGYVTPAAAPTFTWSQKYGSVVTFSGSASSTLHVSSTFDDGVAVWDLSVPSVTQLIPSLRTATFTTVTGSTSAQSVPVTVTSNSASTVVTGGYFSATGIGAPTYSSGGIPTGTGSCLLASSGGGGTGGQLTMSVSSGSVTGFTVANAGNGYTSEPTSWTYVSGAACSTTVTTTGGALAGAQGVAMVLLGQRVQ